jgi:hypothetical protein
MTVLVSGSRSWTDELIVESALYRVSTEHDTLMHGAARGLDSIAARIGERCFKHIKDYPVLSEHWQKYGKSAGIKRNIAMVDKLNESDIVLAFIQNNSPGTNQCIKYAVSRGITVVVFEQNYPRLDTLTPRL